jgi:hypothetical protein
MHSVAMCHQPQQRKPFKHLKEIEGQYLAKEETLNCVSKPKKFRIDE